MSAAKDGLVNPAPLGLCGFALTTWLLSLINNGTYTGENIGLVLAMGLAFGGTTQMIAGMFEYKKIRSASLPLPAMAHFGGHSHYLKCSLQKA